MTSALELLGRLVWYVPSGSPLRAALVVHVHADGTTADLLVLGEGDPRAALTRQAWALGQGLTRARLDVPHVSRSKGSGLAWCLPGELG